MALLVLPAERKPIDDETKRGRQESTMMRMNNTVYVTSNYVTVIALLCLKLTAHFFIQLLKDLDTKFKTMWIL
jgi:hypothetical protein